MAGAGSFTPALISPDTALSHLPFAQLDADDERRVLHGIDLPVDDVEAARWPDGACVRMRNLNGELVAVGIYDEKRKTLHPNVVIANE